ncbi:MAG: DNRLRE domain-containing protein [Methanotrichaceae archaeon]|nr:DNRLRE domain-containing protein [Methanotrichaceae archaeon]
MKGSSKARPSPVISLKSIEFRVYNFRIEYDDGVRRMGKDKGSGRIVAVAIISALMLLAMPVWANSGLPGGYAKIKDWDQAHEAFSFSFGEVKTDDGDFFIAADRIHVFDSPGIIDMGDIPLADLKEVPEYGFQETAMPIEGHSYFIRSHGKYGKIHIEDIFRPEDYEWISVTEYEIEWVYQPDGSRSFGASDAPSEPALLGQTGTEGEDECPEDAQEAYQQYMTAYNKLTSLMAEGKGGTPEGQQAYQEFAKAKTCYESRISETEPPFTATSTPQQTGCAQFEVPPAGEWASESWFNTNIRVTSRQTISITASGRVQPSTSRDLFCGPDGTFAVDYWLTGYSFRPEWGHAALIARIGASGTPIFIGTSTTFTAPAGGELWLGVNDIDTGNNFGKFVAQVCLGQSYTSTDGEQQRLYPVADGEVYAYSYRNWNWANSGLCETMGAGWHPTGGEKRAYLRFDLPAGLDISRALLKLYQYHSAGPVHSLGVYRVTSPWNEGTDTYHSGEVEETAAPGELCWMQQPSFDPVPVAIFTSATATPAYVEVDITPLVQQWQGGVPNYGLVVKTANEHPTASDPEARSGFYTRERPDQANRPVLELSLAPATSVSR